MFKTIDHASIACEDLLELRAEDVLTNNDLLFRKARTAMQMTIPSSQGELIVAAGYGTPKLAKYSGEMPDGITLPCTVQEVRSALGLQTGTIVERKLAVVGGKKTNPVVEATERYHHLIFIARSTIMGALPHMNLQNLPQLIAGTIGQMGAIFPASGYIDDFERYLADEGLNTRSMNRQIHLSNLPVPQQLAILDVHIKTLEGVMRLFTGDIAEEISTISGHSTATLDAQADIGMRAGVSSNYNIENPELALVLESYPRASISN